MKRIEELNKEAVECREYGLMVLAVALAVWLAALVGVPRLTENYPTLGPLFIIFRWILAAGGVVFFTEACRSLLATVHRAR